MIRPENRKSPEQSIPDLHRNIGLGDNTGMEYIGIFEDFTDDGLPRFAIYTADEDYLCTVVVPIQFIEHTSFEIGDEVRIIPQKST